MTSTMIVVAFIVAAVLSIVWLWLLHRTYRRRNWARITLTVLGGLWLLPSVGNLTGLLLAGENMIQLSIIQIALLIVTLSGLNSAPTRSYCGTTQL